MRARGHCDCPGSATNLRAINAHERGDPSCVDAQSPGQLRQPQARGGGHIFSDCDIELDRCVTLVFGADEVITGKQPQASVGVNRDQRAR
jgi:hypothetical protein